MSDSDIRREIISKLNDDVSVDEEELVTHVADELQVDSEDVRRVLESGIGDGTLERNQSFISFAG